MRKKEVDAYYFVELLPDADVMFTPSFEDIADKSFPTLVSNKRALLFNDIDLFCAIDVNFASCP